MAEEIEVTLQEQKEFWEKQRQFIADSIDYHKKSVEFNEGQIRTFCEMDILASRRIAALVAEING